MYFKLILLLLLVWLAEPAAASPIELTAVKVVRHGQTERLSMEFTGPVRYRVGWASDKRLRIDLANVVWKAKAPDIRANGLIGKVLNQTRKADLVLTLALRESARAVDSIRALGPKLARLQVDLQPEQRTEGRMPAKVERKTGLQTAAQRQPATQAPRSAAVAKTPAVSKSPAGDKASVRSAKHVIAIDAGHGGKDTGAVGELGTREKDVVLAIARRLAEMARAENDLKPVLIRSGDRFFGLRERIALARQARADLFVSLHADAFVNASAKGSSVFTVSTQGATSEAARWLANKENSAELRGGVKLRDKDKILASVLLDLSQSATREASDRAALKVLRELRKLGAMHGNEVQKAGFAVLKSPDIPSLLIETGFISNPDEERKLRDPRFQNNIARAVFKGIRAYFPPARKPVVTASRSARSESGRMMTAQR